MAVEEEHENGRVGRGLVQLLDGGHAIFLELVGRPAADDADPFAIRHAGRFGADQIQRAGQCRDAVPARLQIVEAPAADLVGMRVVQARNDRATVRVDHLRIVAAIRLDIGVAADFCESTVAYGEGRGLGLCGAAGKDGARVHYDKVGGLLVLGQCRRACGQGAQGHTAQGCGFECQHRILQFVVGARWPRLTRDHHS